MNHDYFKFILAVFLIVAIISGCERKIPTWEDPNPSGALTPIITSIEPDSAYSGELVTVTGENFNPDPEKNFIAFGKSSTTADSATESTLKLNAPPGGGMEFIAVVVKVASEGSEYWSNELDFTYRPILSIFRDDFSCTRGIEFDQDGNCYVSDPDDGAIYKITTAGDKTEYCPDIWVPGDLSFDRDGYLYACCRWDGEIWRVIPGGGSAEFFTDEVPDPFCIDWDDDGNMYVVAEWEGIYRITPGGTVSQLDVGDFQHGASIRVFDGYIYWGDAGDWGDGNNHIMRAPITPEGVGEAELVYEDPDWNGTYIWGPSGINIDNKGNVYAVSRYWDGCPKLSRFLVDGTPQMIVELPSSNNKFIAFWDKFVYITTQWEGVIYEVYVGEEGAPPYAWGP